MSGTEISLQELINLRHVAKYQPLQKKRMRLAGDKLTQIRGRGIEFDATREYQPGDDIRHMAWRVTARSLKPHIKVYREEKERSIWLAIDLSPSLYFGTRVMFKSVQAIRQAVLTGWAALMKGERVGAIIGVEPKPIIFEPDASERHFLAILNVLANCSRLQPVFDERNYLGEMLSSLQLHLRSDHMVYVYSDFQHEDSVGWVSALFARNPTTLCFIYDPIEATPPPPHQYQVTNGQQKMVFNMQDAENRKHYQQQFQQKWQELRDFSQKYGITFNHYCTDQTNKVAI